MKDFHDAGNILTDPIDSAACPKCSKMLSVQGLPVFSIIQCPHCTFEFQVPARFGGFMLLELLGAGGMGSVFRARDEGLNREVAIKVMLKSLGDDPQFVETFQREAQAAAQLNHRHIAQIYSFGQEKGQPYIAMELVSGGSLDKLMEEGEVDPAAVVLIGSQIAEGLSAAADLGMVHGDVKPENILFDADKKAKLVDFGLAAMQSGPNNDIWGTPYYIAPEKVRRQSVDFRSDIYSLGGTMYHAIAGVPPFEGEDATAVVKARFEGPPKALGEYREGIAPELEALIGRMLAVEPQTRYPTYGSLLGDMRRFLSKAGPVSLTKSSKRIMIRGKHGGLAKRQGAGGATALAVDAGQLAAQKSGGSTAPAFRKQETKSGSMVAVWIVLAILASAGLIAFAAHHQKSTRLKAERTAIVEEQDRARSNLAKSQNNAKILVQRTEELAREGQKLADEAVAEVVRALGEEIRPQLQPDQKKVQQATAKVAEKPVAPEAEKLKAVAQKVATGNLDAAIIANIAKLLPADLAREIVALNTTDAKKIMEFAEKYTERVPPNKAAEMKALILAGVPDPQEPEPEPEPVAAGAVTPAVVEEGQELTGEAKILATVREMQVEALSAQKTLELAREMQQEVEQQSQSAINYDQITTEHAEALAKLSNALVERVNQFGNSKAYGDLGRKVSQIRRAYDGIKLELASMLERRRIEQLAEERRLRAEAKAEEERLEREAYAQKVQGELEKAREAEAASLVAVQQLSFREAIRNLRSFRDDLETTEAKDLVTVAIDRVLRLSEFHDFLVKKVVGYRSARGWVVEDANARNLIVGGRPITWVDVFSKRKEIAAELINSVALGEETMKDFRLREKTTMMTNAALCLSVFYKGDVSATERAKDLATEAARQFEVDAPTIKALMPEFFE